jgi:hypothetical protein
MHLHPCLPLFPPLKPVDQPCPARSEAVRPDLSQPAQPRCELRSESARSIRVSRLDLSRPARSESARWRTVPSLCPLQIRPALLRPPVRSSQDGHGSQAHYFKGFRGYRAIAKRQLRGRHRRRPAAPPGGRCAACLNSSGRPGVVLG